MQKLFVFIGEAREGGGCVSPPVSGGQVPRIDVWGGGIDLGSGRWWVGAAAGRQAVLGQNRRKKSLEEKYLFSNGGDAAVNSDSEGGVHLAQSGGTYQD